MAITIQEIAAALGKSPEQLAAVLSAGEVRITIRATEDAIAQARSKSEALLSVDRENLGSLQQVLLARQGAHMNVIARLESLLGELNAGQRVDAPNLSELLSEIA